MRIKMLFVLLCIFIFTPIKSQNTIKKIVVYKSFWRGGTSTMVSNMFIEPKRYSINTTNINIETDKFLTEFGAILSRSKQKKYRQQKIAEIEVAGEFWLNQSDKHFFIICLPNLLIDITDKKEYKITDDLLLNQMNKWLNNLKVKRSN